MLIQRPSQRISFRAWSNAMTCLIVVCTAIACSQRVNGQLSTPKIPQGHQLQHGNMPPGMIGNQRMIARPQMIGYMQPVQFHIPAGCEIAIWNGEDYQKLDAANAKVRLQLGSVYRLKVTKIRRRTGKEVFPSIEILNRLYPPPGQADRFPVMVHITEEELEKAVDGHYVHRVTYLENPETAVPFRQVKGDQSYFRVRQDDDPLKVAAQLGRPMTLVRMGSRIPLKGKNGKFELGQAPIEFPGAPALRTSQSQSASSQSPIAKNQKMPPVVQVQSTTPVGQKESEQVQKADFQPESITQKNPYDLPKVKLSKQSEFVPPIKSASELRKQVDSKSNPKK